MRVKSHLTFTMDSEEANRLLKSVGLLHLTRSTGRMHSMDVFTDTDEYSALKDGLLEAGVTPLELPQRVYSDAELTEAEFLEIVPYNYSGYPLPDDDGGYKGLSYDPVTTCPDCGNGLIQIAPLRIRRPGFGRHGVFAVHWVYEFIVSRRVRQLIESEGFTGCEFWPVLELRSGKAWPDAWQLFINASMPPMHPSAPIVPSGVLPCACGKRGQVLKGEAVYDRASLDAACDFGKTHEWLGGAMATWRWPMVSQRVYSAFAASKIRGVRFEPAVIVGAAEGNRDFQGPREAMRSRTEPDPLSVCITAGRESGVPTQASDMKDGILRLVDTCGLQQVRTKIVAQMKASIRIIAHGLGDEAPAIGASRIGGLPDVPDDFKWPTYHGLPLSFIAQLRLSDFAGLASPGLFPADGLLSFFFDSTQTAWGFSPQHRDGWKVAFFEGDPSSLKTTQPPTTLPEAAVFAPCRVEYSKEYTIPPFGSADYTQLRLTEAQGDSYFEMIKQLQEAYDPPINRVFGYPDQIQGDVKWAAQMASNGIYLGDLTSAANPRVAQLERGVRDWFLLLQIDSDSAPGMMWGDEGRLYFTIKERDLKAGKFENAWCELQCG